MRAVRTASVILIFAGVLFLTFAPMFAETGPRPVSDSPAPFLPDNIVLTSNALDLAQAMVNDSAIVTGAAFITIPPIGTPHGIGDSPLTGFPTAGPTFAILTNGNAAFADQPNNSGSTSANISGGNVRGNSAFDVSILRIDLDVPAGANCLSIDFRFFSDEYPEYVGSSFNDAFIGELDTSTWTASGSTINAPNNFTFDPSGHVISINAAGVTGMTAANAAGTTYDGATPLLIASTPITAGPHSLFLSIFDQGDRVLDSAVFVDRIVIGSTTPEGCIPGATVETDSNPPMCSVAILPGPPESVQGTADDNRPSEDTNGNGTLDPGEDLNGNGLIDNDTGIFFVELDPGAVNLTPAVNPFVPGDGTVGFTIAADNPALPAVGILRATDGAGNSCTSEIQLGSFDPFGGIEETPTDTITAHIIRPSPNTAGVRCVETTDAANPDFGSIPFTPFVGDSVDIEILLSAGDGTKIICCQFIDTGGNTSPPVCSEIVVSSCAEGQPCDDGNACTSGDTCGGGVCLSGGPANCDDGNVCTDDSCDPLSGCLHTDNTSACEDGNACTTGDTCGEGTCSPGGPTNCDDGNCCTIDACDSATGCTYTANTAPPVFVSQPSLGNCPVLWPPNHKYADFTVASTGAAATSQCGIASIQFASCNSSQPDNGTGTGDGNSVRDCVYEPGVLHLRAERDGACSPVSRVYSTQLVVTDVCGNATTSNPLEVGVWHDRGHQPTGTVYAGDGEQNDTRPGVGGTYGPGCGTGGTCASGTNVDHSDADPEMEIEQNASISVSDLRIEKASGGNVKLLWTEPTHGAGINVTRFHIYRLDPVTLFWTQLAEVSKQTSAYLDLVLNDGLNHEYKVTAVIK